MVNPLTAQGVAVVIVGYDIAPKGNGWSCRFSRLVGFGGERAPGGA